MPAGLQESHPEGSLTETLEGSAQRGRWRGQRMGQQTSACTDTQEQAVTKRTDNKGQCGRPADWR